MHIEKNVLESILNTLLMNDKSKDTTKARQDLKRLGIRSGLWLGQNKNGKCTKPQAAYSFTPGDIKKFCQFIKGVKLSDGFRSNFKHKVTDNDTNITGLKSHDYVVKPIFELCLFFKQNCSQTLMEDAMLKAQSMVVNILCNLELIYPLGFFDIMIHLVIHLPLDALEDDPICPRWMYPFERFMKKLKNHDVTTKFNRPDRNLNCPPPTCQFQVFRSVCKSIGLRSIIRIDHQELKKVIWYILHNSPEIDKYRVKFKRPTLTPISVNSCVVNGVRFVVHNHDECRTTQNNGIYLSGEDGEMYYDGQSIDVDAPPDFIDVDEDNDIINDEDVLPHDLADSDDEDLVNVDDDDGVAVVFSSEEED
ncbi:hypothetical protein Tco_0438076 [Tanacetum coccineum]